MRRNDPALAASELAILNEKVTLATGEQVLLPTALHVSSDHLSSVKP